MRHLIVSTCLGLSALTAAVPAAAQAEQTAPAAAAAFKPAAIVQQVREIIGKRYVIPEKRPAIDAVLAEGLRSGRYRTADPMEFAQRLGADLERASNDRHMDFYLDPKEAAMLAAAKRAVEPDTTAYQRQVRLANHGITELKVLPGNVRYMAYDELKFVGAETFDALDTAMRFLSGGDAIIIDLRRNGGGSGDAAEHLLNYFLPGETKLYSYLAEGAAESVAIATPAAAPPGGRITGKPLYFLISGETASAAEGLVGPLAGYKVAELIGANTAGAGYENTLVPIDDRFVLSVSIGRVVIAPTGRDWERVGIAPTIPTAVPLALDVAHAHALRRLAATATAGERPGLEATAEWLDARAQPRAPTLDLAAYAAAFGERKVWLDNGKLTYRNGEQASRVLVPLGGDVFAFDDEPLVQVRFATEAGRVVALEIVPAGEKPQGRYDRTG